MLDLEARRRGRHPGRRAGAARGRCRCAAPSADAYLRWAVDCFRLATAGVGDETQIHTHMCYSEFGEILAGTSPGWTPTCSRIEASRSRMELLDELAVADYPNEIGPGVYDIHSPRVPGDRGDRAAADPRRALGSPASGSGSIPTAA